MPVLAREVRCTLLGIGAMNSPRFKPAGVLVSCAGYQVMIDGGPEAAPLGKIDAWLVSDDKCELMAGIRASAKSFKLKPIVGAFSCPSFRIEPQPVVHTSHPAFGYLLTARKTHVAWAPEFFEFPKWADGASLMFAEAAGWKRPIRFAGGVGGHSAALDVALEARRRGVHRLIFAHLGRPTIRALDAGERPPFGEIGVEGRTYRARIFK